MNSEKTHSFTILVIDDNPLELGLIRLVIQKNFPELKVLGLTKPVEWSEFFQGQNVDAIIVDYRLPGKNGLEVIKDLRKYNQEIPAFLITALERDEIEQDIIKSGATDLIVKDRSYSNLVSKLNDLILKKSFKKFETEIKDLKKIIHEFTHLLILKIDYQGNCVEIIGKVESVIGVSLQEFYQDWKKYFYDLLTELRKSIFNTQNDLSIAKSITLDLDGKIVELKVRLFKSHFDYLILEPRK